MAALEVSVGLLFFTASTLFVLIVKLSLSFFSFSLSCNNPVFCELFILSFERNFVICLLLSNQHLMEKNDNFRLSILWVIACVRELVNLWLWNNNWWLWRRSLFTEDRVKDVHEIRQEHPNKIPVSDASSLLVCAFKGFVIGDDGHSSIWEHSCAWKKSERVYVCQCTTVFAGIGLFLWSVWLYSHGFDDRTTGEIGCELIVFPQVVTDSFLNHSVFFLLWDIFFNEKKYWGPSLLVARSILCCLSSLTCWLVAFVGNSNLIGSYISCSLENLREVQYNAKVSVIADRISMKQLFIQTSSMETRLVDMIIVTMGVSRRWQNGRLPPPSRWKLSLRTKIF